MKYQSEKNFIIKTLKKAYRSYCKEKIEISQKTDFDLVTSLDKKIEKFLIKAIKSKFPNDEILSEEYNCKNKIKNRTWTIDPIDGTCNMAHGSMIFGLQCSLIENGEIKLGVIYLPNLKEVYYAVSGCGCYLNNKKIINNKITKINNSIISVGDFSHKREKISKIQLKVIDYLRKKIAKIRMFGSASYDLSFAACGRTDGTTIVTKNLWDIAPGIIICREAGLKVVDLKGNEYNFTSEGIIVSKQNDIAKILINSYK